MFRGREMSHPELGKEILDRVAEKLGGLVSIEREARMEGRNMFMILAPKQKTSKKKVKQEESNHAED